MTYPLVFSILTLGSFDDSGEDAQTWISIVCLVDFVAMTISVVLILLWDIQSNEITKTNDANHQSPSDYTIKV